MGQHQETCREEIKEQVSNNQILIQNIRRVIKEKGLKQCAVAEKVGVTPNIFSSMLNERKIITAEHIPNIANALDVSVNELYRKEGE